MPDISGIELCRRLRQDFRQYYAYIIILTGHTDKEEIIEGLASGADDYLTKPFYPGELRARVEVGRRIVELHREIEAKNRLLEELSLTDSLTGLPNRRAIELWASRQLSAAARHDFPIWLVMADLDFFKKVNDTYGHNAGDAVLKGFAEILIALAVSNLNLREALRLQAIRDPLTGLYNRRYMQEFLEREIHRARRRGRPLAVMMLDLDNFKRYNDTFGHPAGDEALRFVGDTLLLSVRSEDLACRYGGEEFCVILPECSLQQAAVRAEEIRTRLKELHSERASEIPGVITVSIGVAAFEETTDKGNLLLKFADDALYQAKRAGRDRVVVARPATGAARLAATPT
jgi:diguanylate cyclase (GGDEF)-like protein